MPTYKFSAFGEREITNPQITVLNVIDNIVDKTCSVQVLLATQNARFKITLTGFTYEQSWEDSDIVNWVSTELVQHEVAS